MGLSLFLSDKPFLSSNVLFFRPSGICENVMTFVTERERAVSSHIDVDIFHKLCPEILL